MRPTFLPLAIALSLGGCASIVSVKSPAAGDGDGLTYFMPRKDILVTLHVDKDTVTTATISTTSAYPDRRTAYVLSLARNLVGKNTLDVSVSEQGLLSSAHGSTEGGLGDAFKGLAAAAGTISALNKDFERRDKTEAQPCASGDHVFQFQPAQQGSWVECQAVITISALGGPPDPATAADAKESGSTSPGLFYRQSLPYAVTVDTPAIAAGRQQHLAAALLFSPSESPTRFLPISRALFATADTKVAFVDGVPTNWTQNADGEAVALLKLPADVFSSYFSAIGSTFDAFKSNSDKQADALASSLQLQMAQRKYDACLAALKAKDNAAMTALGC